MSGTTVADEYSLAVYRNNLQSYFILKHKNVRKVQSYGLSNYAGTLLIVIR
jgi:hypothetical protein